MPPRPYQPGKRRLAATEATRSKIVAATRDLLADRNVTSLSIDAVAQRADVARITIYYQFKSKAKLLEALFDDFGARASMRNMRRVFEECDPETALSLLIEVFCNLWKTQGGLLRRLAGFAALDHEVETALAERGGWRREAIERVVGKMPGSHSDDLVDVIYALTSLETYSSLCTGKRSHKKVVALLQRSIASLLRR
jgi:AcrR family transcriptional regulator